MRNPKIVFLTLLSTVLISSCSMESKEPSYQGKILQNTLEVGAFVANTVRRFDETDKVKKLIWEYNRSSDKPIEEPDSLSRVFDQDMALALYEKCVLDNKVAKFDKVSKYAFFLNDINRFQPEPVLKMNYYFFYPESNSELEKCLSVEFYNVKLPRDVQQSILMDGLRFERINGSNAEKQAIQDLNNTYAKKGFITYNDLRPLIILKN